MELIAPTRQLLIQDADIRFITFKRNQQHDDIAIRVDDVKIIANHALTHDCLNPLFQILVEQQQQRGNIIRCISDILREKRAKISTETLFHAALLIGDKQLIDTIVDREVLSSTRSYTFEMTGLCCPRRLNGLQVAAIMGHHRLVSKLSEPRPKQMNGTDPNSIKLTADKEHEQELKDADKTQSDDINPLLLAARFGRTDTVDKLLKPNMRWKSNRIDINDQDDDGFTSLHLAVCYDHSQLFNLLVDRQGVDVNSETKGYVRFPIAFAAALGCADMLDTLKRKSDKPALVKALHAAAAMGEDDAVSALMSLDASLGEECDDAGNTSMSVALAANNVSTARHQAIGIEEWHRLVNDTSPRIMTTSADNIVDSYDYVDAAVDLVIRQASKTSLSNSDNDAFKVETGANKTGKRNWQLVSKLVKTYDFKKISELLAEDVIEPSITNKRKESLLHFATFNNTVNVFRDFISLHVFEMLAEWQNADHEIPLHVAVRMGHIEAVRSLLDVKSTLSSGDTKGRTALHLAVYYHQEEKIVSEIIESLQLPNQLDAEDIRGRTALHYAVIFHCQRHCRCIQLLSELSPGPVGKEKISALHLAAALPDQNVLEAVLATFYNRNGKRLQQSEDTPEQSVDDGDSSKQQQTALMICADNGDVDGVMTLLSYGARLEARDADGRTVLHRIVMTTVSDEPSKLKKLFKVFDAIASYAGSDSDNICQIDDPIMPLTRYDDTKCTRCVRLEPRRRMKHLLMHEYAEFKHPSKHEMNVLQLAAAVGASEILIRILNITHARFEGDEVHYWPQHIIPINLCPKTTINQNGKAILPCTELITLDLWGKEICINIAPNQTELSCLELIALACDDKERLDKMLHVEPLHSIVVRFTHLRIAASFVLIVLHIIHMACFSVYSIQTCYNYTAVPVELNDVRHNPTLYWFCLLLIYPLAKLIYVIVALVWFYGDTRSLHFSALLRHAFRDCTYLAKYFVFELLSHSLSLLFSIISIVWYIQLLLMLLQSTVEFPTYARTVAMTLLIGWLYTIELLRGIPTFQVFAKYLKLIIIKDVLRIICVYAFVLIGFALAIYICILVESPNAETVTDTFFQTYGQMFGAADVFGANARNRKYDFLNDGVESVFARALLVVYMLMSTIILINVLIAMMNQSYNAVYEESKLLWNYENISYLIDLSKSKRSRPVCAFLRWYIFRDREYVVVKV